MFSIIIRSLKTIGQIIREEIQKSANGRTDTADPLHKVIIDGVKSEYYFAKRRGREQKPDSQLYTDPSFSHF